MKKSMNKKHKINDSLKKNPNLTNADETKTMAMKKCAKL